MIICKSLIPVKIALYNKMEGRDIFYDYILEAYHFDKSTSDGAKYTIWKSGERRVVVNREISDNL